MNYIENVFACLAAPLVVALFCVHRFRRRSIGFILIGMLACLFSSYINTFLAGAVGANALDAALEISPMIEEILKLAPIAFYLMVFEPKDRNAAAGEAIMIAVGFATLENACYLISSGADRTMHLLIRGFGTGAMHVVCGAVTALALRVGWERLYFRVIAILGALCLVITSHGIYNVLVNQQGFVAWIGYTLPLAIGAATVLIRRKIYGAVALVPRD